MFSFVHPVIIASTELAAPPECGPLDAVQRNPAVVSLRSVCVVHIGPQGSEGLPYLIVLCCATLTGQIRT